MRQQNDIQNSLEFHAEQRSCGNPYQYFPTPKGQLGPFTVAQVSQALLPPVTPSRGSWDSPQGRLQPAFLTSWQRQSCSLLILSLHRSHL